MDRRLTGKERAFLTDLAELMQQYDCLMHAKEDEIRIELLDEVGEEDSPMRLAGIYAWYDIEYFMNRNS